MFFTFAGVLVRTLTAEQTDDFKWRKVKKKRKWKKEGKEEEKAW